jgi:hypothetical protein
VSYQGDPNSWDFRTRYWRILIAEYIDGEPLDQTIAGVGLGTAEVESDEGLEPHSVWVQSLVETGVIGSVGLLTFLGTATVTSIRVARTRPGRDGVGRLYRAIGIASCALIANWLTQSISQNLTTEAVMWLYIAVPLGVVAAASHRSRDLAN